MKKLVIISILTVIWFGCSQSGNRTEVTNLKYNFEVNYHSPLDSVPIQNYRSDSVVVQFGSNFQNDTVAVIVEQDQIVSMVLSTDPMTGFAGHVKFRRGDFFELSFNNGPMINVSLLDKTNFYVVNDSDKVVVTALKKPMRFR